MWDFNLVLHFRPHVLCLTECICIQNKLFPVRQRVKLIRLKTVSQILLFEELYYPGLDFAPVSLHEHMTL